MSLSHRPEISNMRSAYEHDKRSRVATKKSPPEHDNHIKHVYYVDSSSERSNRSGSDKSYETPPTSYASSVGRSPPIVHNDTREFRHTQHPPRYLDDDDKLYESPSASPRISEQSCASIVDSEDEDEQDEASIPAYDPPAYTARPYEPVAIPARPADFSELFPSHRRLNIRHDDSTEDGNMNLRIDTQVSIHGRKCDMTLFHLRMHDLRNREFSLRRYCRDSGREVCHSVRKHANRTAERRPGIQRSLSNALHSMRPKLESRSSHGPPVAGLTRHDSGYGSMHSTDDDSRPVSAGTGASMRDQPLTNSIKLEFSNYAQMEVNFINDKKRRYEFDYWGGKYVWKRISQKGSKEVSFQLVDKKRPNAGVLAYIKPISLTDFEAEDERNAGGWIPQCMMWIADDQIIQSAKDVADAVVAAGLMALVDDSIRSRWHSQESMQLFIPVSKPNADVEYIGPGRLINEMFGRKDNKSSNQSRPPSSDGPSKASRMASGSVRQSSRDY